MKFLTLFIWIIACGFNNTQPLSYEENIQRLESCGKILPEESSNSITKSKYFKNWFGIAAFQNGNQYNFRTVGTFISKRHFLTLAYALMNSNMTWRAKHTKFRDSCVSGMEDSIVPPEVVADLKIFVCPNGKGKHCPPSIPKKAWLHGICKNNIKKLFSSIHTPMLVEVETPIPGSSVCVPEKKTQILEEPSFVYMFIPSNGSVVEKLVNITNSNWLEITTQLLGGIKEYCGSLIKKIHGKWTMIGLGTPKNVWKKHSFFFNLKRFSGSFCHFAGICEKRKQKTTIASIKTTTSIPSTSTLQINHTTGSTVNSTTRMISSTIPSTPNLQINSTTSSIQNSTTSMISSTISSTSSNSTSSTINVPKTAAPEEEIEEGPSEEKDENVDEKDDIENETEVDNDLYVSMDFLDSASGWTIELVLLFVIVFV
ncbi:uncharacterized protein CELE_F15H9.1 [Caenorhabditis elegans]|uniref:Uncharacterized protein n=1 Tax=Caenorhabditis elegans TaxID=6239 RepID=O45371_CAEEL|nr:Uncharacterized protein CELE_F15H9.1 [Caenorhabditis elegans]CAB04116.1 Uncharacterized protein CELE_F15H9.1 [Caenorhabditis elegans]|eukprot:NP_493073.1 Uncharacterized protein CELE_F15H9.1 [Caenorhabditis elegans]